MHALPTGTYVHHVYALYLQRTDDVTRPPGTRITDSFELQCDCWELRGSFSGTVSALHYLSRTLNLL